VASELARFEERYFPGTEGRGAVYIAATIDGHVRVRVRGADGQIVAVDIAAETGLQMHQAVRTKAQRASKEVRLA
jgi:hypothetical protein